MISKIKLIIDFILNTGLRYIVFRLIHLVKSKFSFQKLIFPSKPSDKIQVDFIKWKNNSPKFFFNGKNDIKIKKIPSRELKQNFENIRNGKFIFFGKKIMNLGIEYDWVTNPRNNYRYNINDHWSKIEDLSSINGDSKYVWEKARFCFLYDVIRYDYNFNSDQSKFVFNQIEDFIDKNPINCGPNYICSQEISLRILNWTFAIYYYKDSINLNQKIFSKIFNSIYWQLHHIYKNINFSRFSVRNNHAVTETLMLFVAGKLFPFLTMSKWGVKGRSGLKMKLFIKFIVMDSLTQ